MGTRSQIDTWKVSDSHVFTKCAAREAQSGPFVDVQLEAANTTPEAPAVKSKPQAL